MNTTAWTANAIVVFLASVLFDATDATIILVLLLLGGTGDYALDRPH